MNKIVHIPFNLRGIQNTIEVIYRVNESAWESGFDALLGLPFDPHLCIGYPTVHAYIKNMTNTGYRRLCGWIQLVQRAYFSSDLLETPDENELSIDSNDPHCIYFAYGSPAEIYDAPCNNLNGNVKGTWTAYTYLVDMPSRMNGNKLSFLAGFQWGYEETLINGKLVVKSRDLKELDNKTWNKHISYLKTQYPCYEYI
ncbi:MAG: hypothetical protein LBK25_06385 [Treponema sp.]|nr:hypothetical protein [Treponema sp.]